MLFSNQSYCLPTKEFLPSPERDSGVKLPNDIFSIFLFIYQPFRITGVWFSFPLLSLERAGESIYLVLFPLRCSNIYKVIHLCTECIFFKQTDFSFRSSSLVNITANFLSCKMIFD